MAATKKTATKKTPASNQSGNEPKKNPQRQALDNINNDGFRVVKKAKLAPFVDWDETPMIEGVVTNYRTIKGGKFGDQDAVDVGEHSVGLTASLITLPDHEGEYVRIIYEGEEITKKGNTVKTFTILVKDKK